MTHLQDLLDFHMSLSEEQLCSGYNYSEKYDSIDIFLDKLELKIRLTILNDKGKIGVEFYHR